MQVLYLIGTEPLNGVEFVKVGISNNPNVRLRQLQTGCPLPLRVAYIFNPNDYGVEAQLLERYAHAALSGHRVPKSGDEWFQISAVEAVRLIREYLRKGFKNDVQED